jgi:hypothetical protein
MKAHSVKKMPMATILISTPFQIEPADNVAQAL